MSKLPDWVLKHKVKGTDVITKNGNYYLYRVHSERRPDKTYPVLVTDEYLGVITEDGLIPRKQRIDDIIVKEYGLSKYFINLILSLFSDIDSKLLVSIVLTLAYDKATIDTYNASYISELYPDSFPSKNLNYDSLRQVYKVKINGNWFNANISESIIKELNKYSIIME